MQTIEALLSLMFILLMISNMEILPSKIDYSLYSMLLIEDFWRVLYLNTFNESAIEETYQITNLCVYVQGIEKSSCRGESYRQIASKQKLYFEEGKLKIITISVGPKK